MVQQLVDLVGGFVGNIERMFGMLLLAGLGLSAIIALTIYSTAPVIAEEAGERIENYAERQMDEAIAEKRAAKCARLRAKAAEAWDRAVANDLDDRAYAKVDAIDREAEIYCAG